jgi:hypothetical protein
LYALAEIKTDFGAKRREMLLPCFFCLRCQHVSANIRMIPCDDLCGKLEKIGKEDDGAAEEDLP